MKKIKIVEIYNKRVNIPVEKFKFRKRINFAIINNGEMDIHCSIPGKKEYNQKITMKFVIERGDFYDKIGRFFISGKDLIKRFNEEVKKTDWERDILKYYASISGLKPEETYIIASVEKHPKLFSLDEYFTNKIVKNIYLRSNITLRILTSEEDLKETCNNFGSLKL